MIYTPSIVELITSAFSDDELQTLCFEHFQAVLNDFTAGMTKTQMVLRLLEYCISRGQQHDLIRILRHKRPALSSLDERLLDRLVYEINTGWDSWPGYERLVGRDALVAEVCGLLGLADAGETQGVILYGPSGVGKTAIAIEAVNGFIKDRLFDVIIPHQVRDSRTDNALTDLLDSISQGLALSRDTGDQQQVVINARNWPTLSAKFRSHPVSC
jgi:hypothetical protein